MECSAVLLVVPKRSVTCQTSTIRHRPEWGLLHGVIPAQAGIRCPLCSAAPWMDSCLLGNDGLAGIRLK